VINGDGDNSVRVQEICDFDAIFLAILVYDIGESSKQIKL
jgi:hypothetical protein